MLFKRRPPSGSETETIPSDSVDAAPRPLPRLDTPPPPPKPDNGLGVPPYRPAPPKEAADMGRVASHPPFRPLLPPFRNRAAVGSWVAPRR